MNIENALEGWVSPVELIYKDAQKTFLEQTDEHIMARVESELGVKVDRDELIKAMNYDREQYEKGFENGYKKRDEEIVRCKDCKFYLESKYWSDVGRWCHKFAEGINLPPDGYCSYGERKDDE